MQSSCIAAVVGLAQMAGSIPPSASPDEIKALEASLAADAAAASVAATSPRGTSTGGAVAAGPALDLALILDVAGAWFSDPAPVQGGGHDPSGTGFTFQQLELSAGASVDPFLRFDANLVFTPFGVEVEEAYATATALPGGLQLRAGQFLTRFGRVNSTHPHAWRFLDQTLMVGRMFGSEGNRGLGAEVSWLTPLPWFVELTASGIEGGGECCAKSHATPEALAIETPLDLVATATVDQFFALSPSLSLLWGLSFQTGPNASGQDNRTDLYGTDLMLRWKPVGDPNRLSVNWESEWVHRRAQAPRALLSDDAGYTQLVGQWTPEWGSGLRAEYASAAQADALATRAARHRLSAQATYSPSHFSRLRLQLNADDVPALTDPVLGVMLGLEVITGSHGSHAY